MNRENIDEATRELVQTVKDCGQSIIDNAEKIVNQYDLQTDELIVTISLPIEAKMPTITVDSVFIPDTWWLRKQSEGTMF